MVRFLSRLAIRRIWARVRSLFIRERTQWFIAFRARTGSRTLQTDQKDLRVVVAPSNRFYADPFLIKQDGKNYLFFEDFDFSKNRASIAFAELKSGGRLSEPRTALQMDSHLSYPFVFESQGHVYMIPETKERKTIELYRAQQFPHKWALLKVLAENVLAVDSTVFQYEGKFWLFTNIAAPGASTYDELHVFYAKSLQGPWAPHPRNPVVSDVRRARPAGALFVEDGRIIRPSQDCSVRYGSALCFNEVQILSETEYREASCGRIDPKWYPGAICTHTYNRTEEFEVLDGMRIKRTLAIPLVND
jgi:hypothetical protein